MSYPKSKTMVCPSCRKKTVEIIRITSGGFWLIKCWNGECDELPEVYSKTRQFAIKLFEGLNEKNTK
jgi:hypothetical protein